MPDTPSGDQTDVYEDFKEQLNKSPEGWYETGLPWRGNHPPPPNNKTGSLKRLGSTIWKLEKNGILKKYDTIIKDQLDKGILEQVSGPPVEEEFYILRKAVVGEAAESTKLRIVSDAQRGFKRRLHLSTSAFMWYLCRRTSFGLCTFPPSRFNR